MGHGSSFRTRYEKVEEQRDEAEAALLALWKSVAPPIGNTRGKGAWSAAHTLLRKRGLLPPEETK